MVFVLVFSLKQRWDSTEVLGLFKGSLSVLLTELEFQNLPHTRLDIPLVLTVLERVFQLGA